jgi:hypothetical protein
MYRRDWMMPDREFWLAVRQALLLIVGAIERMLGINPTTAECRDKVKNGG